MIQNRPYTVTYTLMNENSILNIDLLNGWRIVNDDVMGGVSNGNIMPSDNGMIVFSGEISLQFGGGFSSLRSPVYERNWNDFRGIQLICKGDGRTYQISLKDSPFHTRRYFIHPFLTEAGKWEEIYLPFDEFQRKEFNTLKGNTGGIPLEAVYEISVTLADKKAGPFELQIHSISLIR